MNFEKKIFTRSALVSAALMFAGCAAGTPSVSADESGVPAPETASHPEKTRQKKRAATEIAARIRKFDFISN